MPTDASTSLRTDDLSRDREKKFLKSVFINCPYNSSYTPLLQTMVFALLDFGFYPRSALELDTGTSSRFEKICAIIGDCRFGIHDISQVALNEDTGLPQFNMPFELGLFLGASRNRPMLALPTDCLIIGGRQGDHLKAISDLAGHDISFHDYDHSKLIAAIRRFLSSRVDDILPGAGYVMDRRAAFDQQLPDMLAEKQLTFEEMTYLDFGRFAESWLKSFRNFKTKQAALPNAGVSVN